ncbi:MAG TPA: sialidase family protein, partial [Polyangiaceae bacterium]
GAGPYNVPKGALYRYDPKSESWTDVSPLKPNEADHFGYGAVAVDRERPGTLIVSTIDRWTKGGEIFRSTDGAKTWKPLMANAQLDSGGAPYVYAHQAKISAPQWVDDVEIDPFDSNHAALITGAGSWATEDLAAADGDHPTHWTFRNQNLEETVVLGMVSPPTGAPLLTAMGDLCGFRHDTLEASPSRGSFDHPLCANSTAIDYAEKKPDYVVRVGSYPWDGSKGPRGALSHDGGASWTELASEPPGCGGSGTVALSADGAVIVWASRDARPAYSNNSGATWGDAAGLPDPAKIPDWAPHNLRLASDRMNPKKFYAFDAGNGTAYASNDGGAHFRVSARGLPSLPNYDLGSASIQAVPGYEGDIWVTSGKELYRSTDSGGSYAALSSAEEAYSVGFGHAPPGKKYPAIYLTGKVQGVTGFFRSDDEGHSFSRINDDAHQYGGSHLVIGDPRVYGRVYVAGSGRGVLCGEPINQ